MSGLPAAVSEPGALRAELQQLRRERDALAARVLELEQQVAATTSASRPTASAGFEESFRVEQSRAKRQRLALSVALVELDGIQDLRDRLGHSAGEEALAHLARVLERSLRPTDVVSPLDRRIDLRAWNVSAPIRSDSEKVAAPRGMIMNS